MPEYTFTRPALLKFVQNGSGFIHLRLGLAALFWCPRICRKPYAQICDYRYFQIVTFRQSESFSQIHSCCKELIWWYKKTHFLRIQNSKKPPFRLAIEFFSQYPFLSKEVCHVTFMSCLLRGIKFFFRLSVFKWQIIHQQFFFKSSSHQLHQFSYTNTIIFQCATKLSSMVERRSMKQRRVVLHTTKLSQKQQKPGSSKPAFSQWLALTKNFQK